MVQWLKPLLLKIKITNNNLDLNLKIENEDIDMFNLQFLERDNNNDNIKNMSQNYMEFKPKVSISDILG